VISRESGQRAKRIANGTLTADERRERTRETCRLWRQRVRERVLQHYGCRCICCGETQKEFLAVDHIDGGGLDHRNEIGVGRNGTAFYSWIIKNNFPSSLQLLCHNCNLAKGFYGECPHRSLDA
jgi:hypothetical protein